MSASVPLPARPGRGSPAPTRMPRRRSVHGPGSSAHASRANSSPGELDEGLAELSRLARLVEGPDPEAQRHGERVADLSGALARRLGWPERRVPPLEDAAALHDVGKVGIPDSILLGADPLRPDELARIQDHPARGAEMVAMALSAEQAAWVRSHHERWDGAGYPDRLAGEEIPEGAAIIAVADAWDVMTTGRPYQPARSADAALHEVRECTGQQFAPRVAAAFAELLA